MRTPATKTTKCDRMTPAQKRVAIAKDAIKQIKAGKYHITHGQYLGWGNTKRLLDFNQATLLSGKPCKCCQLGAALASALRKFNHGNLSAMWSRHELFELLEHWFPPRQMVLMECAFENGTELPSGSRAEVSFTARLKAKRLFPWLTSPTTRARAIFKNIIKNKGNFKP